MDGGYTTIQIIDRYTTILIIWSDRGMYKENEKLRNSSVNKKNKFEENRRKNLKDILNSINFAY